MMSPPPPFQCPHNVAFDFNIKTRRFPDWSWHITHVLYLRKKSSCLANNQSIKLFNNEYRMTASPFSIGSYVCTSLCSRLDETTHLNYRSSLFLVDFQLIICINAWYFCALIFCMHETISAILYRSVMRLLVRHYKCLRVNQ